MGGREQMPVKFVSTAVRTAAAGALATAGLWSAPAALAVPPPVIHVPCDANTLTADISGAVSGETLSLTASCRYVLTAALLATRKSLNIGGNEAAVVRSYAPGTPDFSILTVSSGDLAVSHLNFRNGRSVDGGAIDSQGGTVTVNGGTFTGNTASGNGGAIDNFSTDEPDGGTMTVTGATFTRNTAGEGGAIDNGLGTLTVTGSTFTGNTASGNGGAIDNFG